MLDTAFLRAVHGTTPTLEKLSPFDRMAWAYDVFKDDMIVTSSFGHQAAATLHLATRINPNIRVLFIDTGFLFPETYQFVDELTQQLKLNLVTYKPLTNDRALSVLNGSNYTDNHEDLKILSATELEFVLEQIKLEPMARATSELSPNAWVSGVRRTQSDFRASKPVLESQNGIVKIYPIIDWDNQDLHRYMKENNLPYHPLFESHGYNSIGNWFEVTSNRNECGLHKKADSIESFDPKI